jgi:hypothetical protein
MQGSLSTVEGNGDLDVDSFNASLKESLELAQAHHSQLILLVLGGDGLVKDSDMHPFQRAMLQFAQAEHVPVINMIEVMRDKDQNVMYMDPAHPTVAGHKVIAEELYKIIRLLPVYNEACQVPGVNVANSAPVTTPSNVTAH